MTTFAVVAGVAGAGLRTSIVLILGVANLVADGFSMAVGNFLGLRAGGPTGAAAGSKLADRVPADRLRVAFAFVAIAVAGYMAWQVATGVSAPA